MADENEVYLTYPLNKKSKTTKNRKKAWLIIGAIVLILVILGAISGYQVKAAYGLILDGKDHLTAVQDLAVQQDLKKAATEITAAEEDFTAAQVKFNIARWGVIIPYVGTQISAAGTLLDSAVALTSDMSQAVSAGLSILEPLQSSETTSFNQLTTAQKKDALDKLSQSEPLFDKISADIERTRDKLVQQSDFGVMPQINSAKDLILEKLPMAENLINELTLGAKILPKIGGHPAEQQYLFVSQNNNELRASGGFIGNIGTIRVYEAEIKEFNTKGIYNLDAEAPVKIEPPDYLREYLSASTWFLRDANTCVGCVDFGVTARKLLEFYRIETGSENFDGVISITPTFLEDLLKVTGSVTVPGYPYKFDSDNVTETIQQHVEVNYAQMGIPMADRQSIVSDLSNVLLQKVMTLPKEKWLDLFAVLQQAFGKKHAMIYAKNPAAQEALREQGWTSELRNDYPQDFLTIADNNMAALKTDRVMERTINYEVDLSNPSEPTAKLQITYINNGKFTNMTTRYRTWSQVYVPAGASLLSYEGAEVTDKSTAKGELREEIDPNSGRKVWSYFKSIEPGTQETVTINYRLPADVLVKNSYALLFQKQPGTPQFKLNVAVKGNRAPKEVAPADNAKIENNNVTFDSDLLIDREFRVTY